jgi:lysophospholipid acyltransferase (LPLAT)-like uncharacterized protein
MGLIERAAYQWGRWIAAYGQHVAETSHVQWRGLENIPDEPVIWFAWHGANLIGLAHHHDISPRPCQVFIPPGIVGATMRGWVDRAQFEPAILPKDGTGNASAALKAILRGLSKDKDLVIAVDGPHGPSEKVRPGAFWLARITGRPLIAIGVAARPAIRFPRWDRHLIPFPKARMAIVLGKPFHVSKDQEIDQPFLDSMSNVLNTVSRLASEIV